MRTKDRGYYGEGVKNNKYSVDSTIYFVSKYIKQISGYSFTSFRYVSSIQVVECDEDSEIKSYNYFNEFGDRESEANRRVR